MGKWLHGGNSAKRFYFDFLLFVVRDLKTKRRITTSSATAAHSMVGGGLVL